MASWIPGDDFATFLGPGVGSVDQLELSMVADAACSAVDEACGPQASTHVTGELVEPSSGYLTTRWPVTGNLTATTIAGSEVDVSGWRRANGPLGHYADNVGCRLLLVSYTTGSVKPPEWAVAAAKIIGRHLWATRLGPNRNGSMQQGAGYLIPNQAEALLAPHRLPARM